MPDPASRSAAIRRATLEAHKDVERLDADALRALEALYRTAAADIAAQIRAHAGVEGSVALAELRSLRDQVEARLRDLAAMRDEMLNLNLLRAADLGVRPYWTAGVMETAAAMRVPHEAVAFVKSFIGRDGLQLSSDRVWRIDAGARELVVNAIERAVIQGHGAAQAARELLARAQAVPPELAAKARAADAGAIAEAASGALVREPANAMDAALRLMRTEINRAHGEAYMSPEAEKTPGFAAWQYLLSPAHHEPDICDLLSTQNLYGLGEGCYPSREKTPWPAHPNTLSFIVMKFSDQVTDADRKGRESAMEALERLPEAKREGVLGKAKAELYDAGKLTGRMIRTPLSRLRPGA